MLPFKIVILILYFYNLMENRKVLHITYLLNKQPNQNLIQSKFLLSYFLCFIFIEWTFILICRILDVNFVRFYVGIRRWLMRLKIFCLLRDICYGCVIRIQYEDYLEDRRQDIQSVSNR